jgi:Domain of unknown function (DUF222)
VSADPERSMGEDDQDQILAWEMAALPPSEEPDWYAGDAPGTEPPWEIPDPGDPAWETPDPGDPGEEGASAGAPFAEGGWADALAPDPVLATLVDLVQRDGLGRLDDDQLTGVLQAANRLAAWSASVRVAAVSGLAARRESSARESGDWRPFDHVDDEVAVALTLTRRSAGRLLDLALGLDRLPLTRAALAAGAIDERRAGVIAEEVAGLDDEHAAAVEKLIIGRAPELTSGQLRALVRRAVLSADPKAARRRKQKALQDARVEVFPETSGTAALAGRDLPPAAVLAADKHLTALAQAMKAAGQPATLDILRARAYLHLLSGQPAATLIPATATPGGRPPAGARPQQPPAGPDAGVPFPAAPGPSAPSTPWPPAGGPAMAGLRGTVNLTMPLAAWLGWTQAPGDVPGYGPLDAGDSRTLAGQLAASPASRWCLTLTGAGGHPVAHACARHGPGGPGPSGAPPPPAPAPAIPGPRASPGPRPPATPATPVPDWLRGLTFTTLQTGTCTHPRESRGYQPSPALRHLIQIRNPACTGPGCRRPATRCDLDHVTPYGHGGKTCECNLHPACRHNHHTKQTPGWTLTQPQPGTLIWTTPGNRTHTTTPAEYWE